MRGDDERVKDRPRIPPEKTGETVDRRQNSGSVKAVYPRHCLATSAPRSCCFNCRAGHPGCTSGGVYVRQRVLKFRLSNHRLPIQQRRSLGIPRDERICILLFVTVVR